MHVTEAALPARPAAPHAGPAAAHWQAARPPPRAPRCIATRGRAAWPRVSHILPRRGCLRQAASASSDRRGPTEQLTSPPSQQTSNPAARGGVGGASSGLGARRGALHGRRAGLAGAGQSRGRPPLSGRRAGSGRPVPVRWGAMLPWQATTRERTRKKSERKKTYYIHVAAAQGPFSAPPRCR